MWRRPDRPLSARFHALPAGRYISDMRLRVLGTLELVGAVPLRVTKPRRLLAALLVPANTVVSVDRLTDVLWGDAPPEHVDAALH
jgi:DNA-binding SARP family transcriptional activator